MNDYISRNGRWTITKTDGVNLARIDNRTTGETWWASLCGKLPPAVPAYVRARAINMLVGATA